MATRTTVLPAPVDITCPDSVIQEWLDNWNKGNTDPVTLEDLNDITYDFIYRAMDYAANQELCKCLCFLRNKDSLKGDIASALWENRRPTKEDQIQAELMKEIEDLKEFMMNEIEEQKEFIMTKITKLKNKISQKNINS
jgi:hypothetical protein